jgi:hypothetical protein
VEYAGSEVFSCKVTNFEQTCAAQEAFDNPTGLQIPKLKYRVGLLEVKTEIPDYENVLKRAGIRVHDCAEQFENDGSTSSSVLKTLKRSMAAEYSRELSVKVFSGQCRLIELGYLYPAVEASRTLRTYP